MRRNTYKLLLMFLLAQMVIAVAPFFAWGSSFNTFPPLLKDMQDIAITRDGAIFVLREAPFPFNQVWIFDRKGNFLNQWGSGPRDEKSMSMSKLNNPTSMAINSRGQVYVVSMGSRKRGHISIFNPEADGYKYNRSLYQLGTMQIGEGFRLAIGANDALVAIGRDGGDTSLMVIVDEEGRLKNYRKFNQFKFIDVAADDEGNIYAIDAKRKQVVQFDPTGNLVGTPQGHFEDPVALAIGQDGSLYVLDKKTFKLHRLGGGEEISSWGGFTDPIALAVLADKIYVADNGSIKVFDHRGILIRQIGGSPFFEPSGLCRDNDQNIYVADSKLGYVQKFDLYGDLLSTIGHGILDQPLLVATRDGELFVLDGGLMKLFVFSSVRMDIAWDLPETVNKIQVADLRVSPGGDSLLLLQRESFLGGAKLWEINIDTGEFTELSAVSSTGRSIIGLSRSGMIFGENLQGVGDVRFTKPTLVTDDFGDVTYVVDHPGSVSRLRRFDPEGGGVIKQWNSWGNSPELPLGNVVGMLINPDGSIMISDAFWGAVLHLEEDTQGRLIPIGGIELPLPKMVAKRPKTRERPEPIIEEVETKEIPASKKTRYVVITLIMLSIILTISMLRRRKRS